MRIAALQNTNINPQFQGVIKLQNFKKGGEIIERKTSIDLDRGLSMSALENVFDGNWANQGIKKVQNEKLTQYIVAIKQTLDLSFPKRSKKLVPVELKRFETGYSVKVGDDFKITHEREDYFVWDKF